MRDTPQYLGWKLYGLSLCAKLGLFKKKLVIIADAKTDEQILACLKDAQIKDYDEVAIRFSKANVLNLPFYFGKFRLKEIVQLIKNDRKDTIPFVHELVKTTISASVYYDGFQIYIEVWPGIGASRKYMWNECPDMITIKDTITIARFLKNRTIETVEGKSENASPFSFETLLHIAKDIRSQEEKFKKLLQVQSPLLCEVNYESLNDGNVVGMQKTEQLEDKQSDLKAKTYYIATSLQDLKEYTGSKDLFFDIPLSRNNNKWNEIIQILKKFPKVYVKSQTMHLSIILREHGIHVEKGTILTDYEIQNYDYKTV